MLANMHMYILQYLKYQWTHINHSGFVMSVQQFRPQVFWNINIPMYTCCHIGAHSLFVWTALIQVLDIWISVIINRIIWNSIDCHSRIPSSCGTRGNASHLKYQNPIIKIIWMMISSHVRFFTVYYYDVDNFQISNVPTFVSIFLW